MEYIKLKEDGTFDYEVPTYKNTEWDDSHLCPPQALTPEEAEMFRVVELHPVTLPIYDESTHKCVRDGAEFVANEWRYKWTIIALTAEETASRLSTIRGQSLIQINNDDNKIYADVIGNKTTEYLKAAEDARAYKATGYPVDDVPDYVQSWADAKLWTARQACDDIIAQEAAWQLAAKLIREYRLKAKEAVKRANTIEEIETAMATWNGFVTMIRTQLGVH